MANVTIGQGALAGKGVYAARAFVEGELVVPYNLRELTQREFDDLPPGEWEWTHSFHGRIYLFSEPERYVNHSADPNTYPDHTRGGDVALRSIQQGEVITIDDRLELQHELDTFLDVYVKACNSRDFHELAPLISDDAIYWLEHGAYPDRSAIQRAFEDTWSGSENGNYRVADVTWVATNYWVSACTYAFTSDSIDGARKPLAGRGTTVLRRIAGRWKVTHQHQSAASYLNEMSSRTR